MVSVPKSHSPEKTKCYHNNGTKGPPPVRRERQRAGLPFL